jgi:serine/threonine-protein kinase
MQQKILNDRYELEHKIGEGGMARVYRGCDLRLNRPVAIKVLHSYYASDPNFLGRFRHEAQAAANLRHPNIVDVYDVGQDGDMQYIVMEYVEGSDLKSLILQKGALPVEQAVAIAQAVAEALDAAHRAGLIHRDVKPQNIMVGPSGRVKMTDFGIAKSKLSTAMTETGVTFGTADYLSPEQARGQPATPSSDLYALGITLYEMLTGRLPFAGENSIAVAMQHLHAEPPPPRMYNPHIPYQLETLVLRALSKDPAQRPASAYEFARLLRGYLVVGAQETMLRPTTRPAPMRPAPARPAPAYSAPARPPSPITSTTRPPLPPPRPPVSLPPADEGRGMGFGGFLLGLLLLGGILGIVYLVAMGNFNDLFGIPAGASRTQPSPIVATAAPATPTVELTPLPQALVPDLSGMTEAQAIEALQSNKLTPQQDQPRYSDTISAGFVLDQFPRRNTVVTETSVVTFALSLGSELVTSPDVSNLRQASAQDQLTRLGLTVEVRNEPSASVSEGFVIRQEPFAGARLQRGETVVIYVSIGNKVVMPDLTGLTEDAAKQRIAEVGLTWVFSDFQSCSELPADICERFGPGAVVSTIPRGGETIDRGSDVVLGIREP